MNEQQDNSASGDPDTTAATVARSDSSDPQTSVDDETPAPATQRRAGSGLALLALLVAAASLCVSGWQWWQERQGEPGSTLDEIRAELDRLDGLGAELERLGERSGRMEERVEDFESLGGRVDDLAGQLEALTGRIESVRSRSGAESSELRSLADSAETLSTRVAELERSVPEQLAELREQLTSNRQREVEALDEGLEQRRHELVLLEAAGLLRLGQARAQLSADFVGARAAYAQASARLQTLDGEGLDRLRRMLEAERESLEQIASPDWARIGTRLAGLDGRAAEWTLASASVEPLAPREADAPAEAEGWWHGMRRALGGLVRVSERDRSVLPESAVESVRERIRLHLAAARAAVARRDAAELSRQVAAIVQLLEMHFDTGADEVESALVVLRDLAGIEPAEVPELGRALAEVERRLAAS